MDAVVQTIAQAQPAMTKSEAMLAEKVGMFLLPIVKTMIAQAKLKGDDATTTFCRQYEATQLALECLPAAESPMARVELELRQRELTAAFVTAHK